MNEGGEGGGTQQKLDLRHLLGIMQMDENLPAQKAAAAQIAQEVINASTIGVRDLKLAVVTHLAVDSLVLSYTCTRI